MQARTATGAAGTAERAIVGFIVRIIVTGIALWVAAALVPGITVPGETGEQVLTLALVAAIFGVVNATIGPVVRVLSFPFVVLTLGLFALVINALLFWFTSWLAGVLGLAFTVDGFGAALIGALIVSVVTWALGLIAGDD